MSHPIDQLVRAAVFGNGSARADARKQIHIQARQSGAVSSSIYPLYTTIARGEVRAFTTPAFNIRARTYDACRALFRAAMLNKVGAIIFEIARSEIGHSEQRPAEDAARVLAAALREASRGPLRIQD